MHNTQLESLTTKERLNLQLDIIRVMKLGISDNYVSNILTTQDSGTGETLVNDIMRNVLETSAWKENKTYNDDDIRLAIGRELSTRLGLDV